MGRRRRRSSRERRRSRSRSRSRGRRYRRDRSSSASPSSDDEGYTRVKDKKKKVEIRSSNVPLFSESMLRDDASVRLDYLKGLVFFRNCNYDADSVSLMQLFSVAVKNNPLARKWAASLTDNGSSVITDAAFETAFRSRFCATVRDTETDAVRKLMSGHVRMGLKGDTEQSARDYLIEFETLVSDCTGLGDIAKMEYFRKYMHPELKPLCEVTSTGECFTSFDMLKKHFLGEAARFAVRRTSARASLNYTSGSVRKPPQKLKDKKSKKSKLVKVLGKLRDLDQVSTIRSAGGKQLTWGAVEKHMSKGECFFCGQRGHRFEKCTAPGADEARAEHAAAKRERE